MSWMDNLQQASFRGVPFKVMDSNVDVGRRNVLHQYPFKDVPYVEDMGADADEFSINAYIIQNLNNNFDYFSERDTLIGAIKEAGPGTLIHPFLGELTVAVLGKARISETFSEGGIARFSITFVQAGENKFPQSPQDNVGAVDEVVDVSLDNLGDMTDAKYSQTNMPGFAVTQAINDVTSGFNMMKSAVAAVRGTVASTVSDALATIEENKALLTSVISAPCELAANVMDTADSFLKLVGLIGETFSSVSVGACSGIETPRFSAGVKIDNVIGTSCVKAMVAVERYGELPDITKPSPYGGQVEEIPVDNYIRAQEKANRIAYRNLIRATALLKAMQVATRIDYYSFEDSFDTMTRITEAVDSLLLDMGNDVNDILFTTYGLSIFDETTYNQLKEAKRIFIKSMKQIGATFANVIEYDVGAGVLSSLELAFDLYNDLDRCETIFERNRPLVKHPGFLTGGETIEVLSE